MKQLVFAAVVAFAVGALAATPKETADALVKEAAAVLKTDTPKALELRLKALAVEGLAGRDVDKLLDSLKWDFTIVTRDAECGRKACAAVAAHPQAKPGLKAGALMWIAESTNEKADYEKAFAVEGLARKDLDRQIIKAAKNLFKNQPDDANAFFDRLIADKETTPEVCYDALMFRADQAKRSKDEAKLYACATAAQKVPGPFDKRQAYYILADYEFGKRTHSRHADPEQMKLYLKWMDAAYEAAVKDMGLKPEVASGVYLLVAERIMWHWGRPDKDSKLARTFFEKAVSLGAKEGTNGEHWGSYRAVKNRLEDLEEKEALFAKFPNRNWRNEDGKMFAEMEKKLDAGKVIHPEWNPDDATEAIQKAIDSDASVIVLDKKAGPWEIEGLTMTDNKKLLLKKGVVLEAKKGGLLKSHSFIALAGTNIVVAGEGENEIRMRKHDYMKDKATYPKFDDNRHGFGSAKKGCQNVWIRNLKIVSTGGDGVCITGTQRIWLDHLDFYDNLRQATTLGTGCHICYMTNCKFNYTWGQEPMSGIDIENWTENCTIDEIYCEDCEFADNRIYGLVLAASTYTPMSMLFKNCEFRNNQSSSLAILNRPGVPTVNKEIFENCRFLQARCVPPIQYVRTLIGNITFKDCLIKEIPGGDSSGTASPISVGLDPDMSDFYVGKNVFENLKIEGYEGAELLAMLPRASGTEYIKDGAFEGVVDFNGKKIDLAKYIRERGLDKPAPAYVPVDFDVAKLEPPALNTAIDAYIPAPHGTPLEMLYWAKKDRVIKLGYFNRVTSWTKWEKGRAIRVIKPDGTQEEVGPMDYTNDYSTCYYTVPADGFYRFTADGNGFWIPADDQAWGYAYRAQSAGGFATINRNTFTGFFEVPAGVKEVTIQTKGGEGFELVDAGNVVMAKQDPCKELKTWTCKVANPGIWRFRLLHGSIRFFGPLNGVFADQPANLPLKK